MKRRNKKPQKRNTVNTVEVFELTEKGREFMELLWEANIPEDDTLSLKALGLWGRIWLMYHMDDDTPVTVQRVLKDRPEPESLQAALLELQTKGHIRIDQNRIITLK